jgi:hypothetical protein
MSETSPRTKHIFVVEIWSDAPTDSPEVWRGVIKHVSHERQRYFSNLADVPDFIKLQLLLGG